MITVNLYYTGTNGNARAFAEEMESSGIAEAIRAELEAEDERETEEKIKTHTEQEEPKQQNPGTVSEAEARKILMEDAMKRKDQKAIMPIPLEDTAALYERWIRFTSRAGSRAGPTEDVRKTLREKRKKKKK